MAESLEGKAFSGQGLSMKESFFGFLIIGILVGCFLGALEGLLGCPWKISTVCSRLLWTSWTRRRRPWCALGCVHTAVPATTSTRAADSAKNPMAQW